LEARASFIAKVPREEEAPYIIKGRGGEVDGRGDQGAGRYWRRKREIAAVVVTRGMVAASVCIFQQLVI
jgi:hypothetical protein